MFASSSLCARSGSCLLSRKTSPRVPLLFSRYISSTQTPKAPESPPANAGLPNTDYHGPLTQTMTRLKIFSLASLFTSTTMTPFIFLVESNIPFMARCGLALTAIGTSGVGTGVISWGSRSYVKTMRVLPNTSDNSVTYEFETATMFLRKRTTRVYDPAFLIDSSRVFSKWELADSVQVDSNSSPAEGEQETVAETFDHKGTVVGRWIVTWDGKGEGRCSQAGAVVRNFNVHE